MCRSSHSEVFCTTGVLKNFPKLTGKHLCLSSFLINCRPDWSCFPVNFAKFLGTTFFIEHLQWLLLNVLNLFGNYYDLQSKSVDWFLYDNGLCHERIKYFLQNSSRRQLLKWISLLLNVNNRNAKTRCEICSELIVKTPERHHWRRSGVFIVNFVHISHLVIVFLWLTLNIYLPAGILPLQVTRFPLSSEIKHVQLLYVLLLILFLGCSCKHWATQVTCKLHTCFCQWWRTCKSFDFFSF